MWCEAEQTYHVLDLLSWKDQRLTDCPSELRLYWLATKLASEALRSLLGPRADEGASVAGWRPGCLPRGVLLGVVLCCAPPNVVANVLAAAPWTFFFSRISRRLPRP